ncbi:MAG: biopolymer transporter ExbD [Bacteroidales bacterium]|jgi:biopolymer transport protein ExbD|nr:biopolymer transporter ExbD [Bacteroidales bacterium]MCR5114659.1 biopolymer transporter ExbD [Bacteroidales bacterium]
MAIKSRHSKKIEPNMSSMSDLVFLLLIFFVITSTLVSPNMISIDLPASEESQQQNPPRNVEVYVDTLRMYYVNPDDPTSVGTLSLDTLASQLRFAMENDQSQQNVVILRADRDVPVQCMVDMMGVVATLNKERTAENKEMYKMAMATVYPSE